MKRLATIVCLAAFVSVPAFGQTCLGDQFGSDPNCTANDNEGVFVLGEINITEGCYEGDLGLAKADVVLVSAAGNAKTRYDLGAFVAQDGGDAIFGDCARALAPVGVGGAQDLETPESSDTCGDQAQASEVQIAINSIVFDCSKFTGESILASVCLSWGNEESKVDTDDNGTCDDLDDLKAGTPSKCVCDVLDFMIELPVELVSFTGDVRGSDVTLRWKTASESNNAGFTIERAYRDSPFAEVGFVTGAGTTVGTSSYSYNVADLQPGRHTFRLKQVDFDGSFSYSPQVEVVVAVPDRFVLEAAYPNPFNPTTAINFLVAESAPVNVTLFNALGREVRSLYQGTPEANRTYTVKIDGSTLPSGTYIVRLEGNNFTGTQQVVLLK